MRPSQAHLPVVLLLFAAALSAAWPASSASAQPTEDEEELTPDAGAEEDDPDDPDAAWAEEEGEGFDEEEEEEEDDEIRLRPPDTEALRLDTTDEDDEDEDGGDDEDDDELPSPGEAAERLEQMEEESSSEVASERWSNPQTIVDLHGYIRFRGNFQDNFFFDRVNPDADYEINQVGRGMVLPFALFRPAEDDLVIPGGCGRETEDTPCDQHANAFANMRLRLEPGIHLSEDVRIRMQLDVFDNMVLGSTPDSFAVGSALLGADGADLYIDPLYRYERTTFAPVDFQTTTLQPPQAGLNSLTDSIVARRAWAEVRARTLGGELRFGRMGAHWGLGILANGGRGIDSDYQTDIDRVLVALRLPGLGFDVFGAWDFTSEGLLYQEIADLGGLAFDRSRLDDTDQFVVGAAYRATDEERRERLARGDAVFNIGGRFVYRNQNLSSAGTRNPFGLCVVCMPDGDSPTDEASLRQQGDPVFVRRGAEVFVPDLWVQFLYEKLRVELEAVFVYGTIDNLSNSQFLSPDDGPALELVQFGFAFEAEYHLLNDQLGIYFYAGYASGDQDVEGLSRIGGLHQQLPSGPTGQVDRTDSTFYFHPNYRIDLIFWRTVMRQIGGAYYFRPGLSYDFIRNSFGQLLGIRGDVVWSRASEAIQSWGNSDDLGVEFDISAYYRSEDGPDLLDGFFASLQWGLFLPLEGLGYLPAVAPRMNPDQGPAMTFRLLLGVQY